MRFITSRNSDRKWVVIDLTTGRPLALSNKTVADTFQAIFNADPAKGQHRIDHFGYPFYEVGYNCPTP